MKTRTILVLLMAGLLLVGGSSSVLADPNAPLTLEVVTGGWCHPFFPSGGIKLAASGGTPPYGLKVDQLLGAFAIPVQFCTGNDCYLDVSALGMSRDILTVTVKDSSSPPMESGPIFVYVAIGHDGVNTIPGHDGPDMLFGLGGWDTLLGRGGNDLLCGGDGDDTLKGDAGLDTLSGGGFGDNDFCFGGPPNTPPGDVANDGTCEHPFEIP